MARIIICDWSKEPISGLAKTFEVVVDGEKFEVSQDSRDKLLEYFQGEAPPALEAVKEAPAPAPAAPPAPTVQLLDVESGHDPFEPGPTEAPDIPETPQTASDAPQSLPEDHEPVKLVIPENLDKPLPQASRSVQDQVIKEAKKFEEGTLPALSPGHRRREADNKLQELEGQAKDQLRRMAGNDVTIRDNPSDR